MASFSTSESGLENGYGTTPGGVGDRGDLMSDAAASAHDPGVDPEAAAVAAANAAVAGAAGGEVSGDYPKILLMGLRRSGKSSIMKVVFHKMSPNETLFLESTNKIVKEDVTNSSFVQFSIWDFPGQIDFVDPTFDSEKVFDRCGAIIFVIDAQDDWNDAIAKFTQTVAKAQQVNDKVRFEVFIHKVDGLTEDSKMSAQQDITQRITDDLAEQGLERGVPMVTHLTSIYDHSIFEAFSKVVQKLIPQLPTLENLLNILASASRMEKVFLFDVVSKIYVATDSSPVDISTYEICCDMIDVMLDISSIYGYPEEDCAGGGNGDGVAHAFDENSSSCIHLNNNCVMYLKEISNVLAIACIFREENFKTRGVIDFNLLKLKKVIEKIFQIREGTYRRPGAAVEAAAAAPAPEGAVGGAVASSVDC